MASTMTTLCFQYRLAEQWGEVKPPLDPVIRCCKGTHQSSLCRKLADLERELLELRLDQPDITL